jgi:hypothetical protein
MLVNIYENIYFFFIFFMTCPHRDVKSRKFFAHPWFCFHFLPPLYSDLSFLAKLLVEYVEQAPYYRYWIKDAGNFLWNPNFFFIFLLRITLTTIFYRSVSVQHIQVIILPENLSQNIADEENEKKTKDLQKISCFVDSFVRV